MKKWKVLSAKKKLSSEIEIYKELLNIRGIKNPESFVNAKLEDLDADKLQINKKELTKAVKIINESIDNNEKIIVLGDYDVDGICASAILWETIYSKYKNVFPYIPDRFSEGYGISVKTIDNLLKKHPDVKLIVTVDNGIVAKDSVDYASSQGIEVIVTDHHLPEKLLPSAHAIVHTTELCGAGVAWVLSRELGYEKEERIIEKLELAALATVTDLVPLVGPSRSILKLGLKFLQRTKRPGLLEIASLSNIDIKNIGVYEIGHIIGPRLNAAGRVDHAIESLRLLCSNDLKFTKGAAFLLDKTNKQRQKMVADSFEHASLSVVESNTFESFIGVHHESYSEGVIGLIASKLVENYYKPSFAISVKEDISKGSARSIKGVNIVEVLRSTTDLLEGMGGHPMAAGFSIKTEKINLFYEKLFLEFQKIPKSVYERELGIDMGIDLNLVNEKLYQEISKLSPFGIGNPEPVFMANNLKVLSLRKLGSDGKHLKLTVGSSKKTIDAIGFNMGDMEISIGDEIDAAFTIDMNVWNGKKTLQLKLKDIKS